MKRRHFHDFWYCYNYHQHDEKQLNPQIYYMCLNSLFHVEKKEQNTKLSETKIKLKLPTDLQQYAESK